MQVSVPPSLPVKRVVSGRWLSCCFKICHKFGCSNAQRFELRLQLPHCYSPGFPASQEITYIQSTVYSIYIYTFIHIYIYMSIPLLVASFSPSKEQRPNGPFGRKNFPHCVRPRWYPIWWVSMRPSVPARKAGNGRKQSPSSEGQGDLAKFVVLTCSSDPKICLISQYNINPQMK